MLVLHSWLRWVVVIAGVIAIIGAVRGRRSGADWTPVDRRSIRAFVGSLDAQFLIGLLLYFVLSPVTPSSGAELKSAMSNAAARFFAVEHPTAMLLGVIVAHVASARAKRAPTAQLRHRRILIGFTIALVLLLAGMPWPFMPAARPLFRLG
jgi:hypothetical protein